tara:strand:+ start:29487 stop:30209 length:723 start_codon:yes stop_codon:yes gene_type:complete
MREKFLIGGIWKGACHSGSAVDGKLFKTLIRALIPVQTAIFEMQGWGGDPAAMPEDIEPIPGICLGDILAEELDADVPYGALVVIRNQNALPNISHSVGALVGEALLRVIGRGMFPLADEDSVLYALGLAYYRVAQAEELVQLGLEPAAFRAGLNAVLARYWAQPSEGMCLFSSDVMLKSLPVLRREFFRSDIVTPSLAALTDFDAASTLNQWTLKLKGLIGGAPGQAIRPAQCGNVGIA